MKNASQINSIHYRLIQKYYYSNGQDTTITPYVVWAVRDSEDSLRNGYIWVDNHYRPYNMIYEKGNFYLAIPPKKITALYPGFSEDFISPVEWIDAFLKPGEWQNQMADSLNTTSVSDTTYKGEDCKKVHIVIPPAKDIGKMSYTYIFSKRSLMPVWVGAITTYEGYTYYDELYFSDYEFDRVSMEELHKRQDWVLTENPIDDRGENSEIAIRESLLHVGDVAPGFEGTFYTGGQKFELSDYVGENTILIDFWYTHCPPCVKSIPSLSSLYLEFEEMGLKIFGLNSVDNQAHSLDYLDKFLKKREVSYDIVMIQPDVDLKYKLKSYPTVYVIDKEGKIAFVELGFNEEKFEVLKRKVVELLNN